MEQHKSPSLREDPGTDIAQALTYLMGDTGALREVMGGFRIKIFHTRAFPWAEVFKTLVYRDFKVYVTHYKADLLIEANL